MNRSDILDIRHQSCRRLATLNNPTAREAVRELLRQCDEMLNLGAI